MTQELSTPEVVTDSTRFQKLAKQHSDLETIVNKHREFKANRKRPRRHSPDGGRIDDAECATWPRKKKSSLPSAKNKTSAS